MGSKIESIPIEQSRTYKASYDITWAAAVEALTSLNFSFDTIDKTSGLINTGDVITAQSGFLEDSHYYGKRGFMGSTKEMANAKLLIKEIQRGQTNVRLIVNIKEYGKFGWFNEESKGVLERKIYDAIELSLKQ